MDDKIIDRIARWLLQGGAQIHTGSHAGAIAGWLDGAGNPAFAYPEITGYYLTCLAFMRELGESDLALSSNASRTLAWMHVRLCDTEAPLTRYYFHPENTDWRNDAIFSFDLAMIFRGLAGIQGLVDEQVRRKTICAVQRQLRDFISSDGNLIPCVPRAAASLPNRWSTRGGPFQLKTAAALLFSGQTLNEDLRKTSLRTLERWNTPFPVCNGQMHAALYAIEGLLLSALNGFPDAWEAAYLQYEKCLSQHDCRRSDVVAQLLRAGCVLRREGLLRGSTWEDTLESLATSLKDFVGEAGQVFYAAPGTELSQHQNSWSAMFALQALTYYMKPAECTERAWRLLC